jgi:hypothetical protein
MHCLKDTVSLVWSDINARTVNIYRLLLHHLLTWQMDTWWACRHRPLEHYFVLFIQAILLLFIKVDKTQLFPVQGDWEWLWENQNRHWKKDSVDPILTTEEVLFQSEDELEECPISKWGWTRGRTNVKSIVLQATAQEAKIHFMYSCTESVTMSYSFC